MTIEPNSPQIVTVRGKPYERRRPLVSFSLSGKAYVKCVELAEETGMNRSRLVESLLLALRMPTAETAPFLRPVRLAEELGRRFWSHEDLAEKAGVPCPAVVLACLGLQPRPRDVDAILAALGPGAAERVAFVLPPPAPAPSRD